MSELDIGMIRRLLPHRYPMLLVDRVLDWEAGRFIRGVKNVTVLGGTDAPFGGADPWAAMRAAVERDLGPSERVDASTALSLFFGDGNGDHCLLHVPLEVALRELDASNVRATFVAGELIDGG